jgi:hypothetical protein
VELLGKVLGVIKIEGSWQFKADGSETLGGKCKAIQRVMNRLLLGGFAPATG